MGTNSAAIFIRLNDIVGTDRDKPAIANLDLTIKFNDWIMGAVEKRLREELVDLQVEINEEQS